MSRHSLREWVSRLALASASILVLVGLLEVLGWVGLVDYPRIFAATDPPALRGSDPWRNPSMQMDPDLLYRRRPLVHLVGETPGDIAGWIGLPGRPLYRYDLRYDGRGFRNDSTLDSAAIVLIGDSFAELPLVPSDSLLSSGLGRRFGMSVVNLGLMAYGPQQELIVLRRYALPLHPDIVVWLFFESNDLNDYRSYERTIQNWRQTMWRNRTFSYNAVRALSAVGRADPAVLPDPRRQYFGVTRTPGDQQPDTLFFAVPTGPLTPADSATLPRVVDVLAEARGLTEQAGARFLLVFVPGRVRVYRDLLTFPADTTVLSWRDSDLPARLGSWAETQGAGYLDLTPALRSAAASGRLVFFTDDAHWNGDGNVVAADTIAAYVREKGWLMVNRDRR